MTHPILLPKKPSTGKLMWSAVRELTTRGERQRVAEPSLLTSDPDSVAAYVGAVDSAGVLESVYLFHLERIVRTVPDVAGQTILDLGCGPGRMSAHLAALFPNSTVIGVDLSEPMLDCGRKLALARGLKNLKFVRNDITTLSEFADGSIAAVVSSLAFHHLPDEAHLMAACKAVKRVLADKGALYISDLTALKNEDFIENMALEHSETQPWPFTLDYFHSLRAAFSEQAWRDAIAQAGLPVKIASTWPIRWGIASSTPRNTRPSEGARAYLKTIKDKLAGRTKGDYWLLRAGYQC